MSETDAKTLTRQPWKAEGCHGELVWREGTTPISFDYELDAPSGTSRFVLTCQIDPMHLHELWKSDGPALRVVTLRGANSTHRISTDSAYVASSGSCVRFSAMDVDIELVASPVAQETEDRQVCYDVAGLRGLAAQADAGVGQVTLRAVLDIDDVSSVSGQIRVSRAAPSSESLSDWLTACDHVHVAMLNMLSFADDHLMSWVSRRAFVNGQLANARYRGPVIGQRPRQPPLWHIHLQTALELAIEHADALQDTPGSVGIAIQWSLMHPPYREGQFLATMTALEYLVNVYTGTDDLILKPGEFKQLAPQIQNTIQDSVTSPGSAEQLCAKLAELNRRSFRSKLKAYLKKHDIPLQGVKDEIEALIDVRNAIVHRGYYLPGENQPSLLLVTAVARELFRRTVLGLVHYKGPYTSYLTGQTLLFPVMRVVE